ncbi:hypothetical protein D3C84_1046210 [compost metagenome]
MQRLALGAECVAGLARCGVYRQCRNVEALGLVRGDQVAVAHAAEGLAVDGLVDVLGMAVRWHHQGAGQFQVGQGGGAGEPGVGEDIELQPDQAADHDGGGGLQGGLYPQLRVGSECVEADQANEQGAECCGD